MELDEVWLASFHGRLQPPPAPTAGCDPRSIFKVPKTLRDDKPSAYDPKVISFGPYHRGREHLKAMDGEKWRYLRSFLTFQPGRTVDDFLRKMKELENRVRSCYADPIPEMNSDEFAEMMLLDGSFLVEFIIKYRRGSSEGVASRVQESIPIAIGTWRFWLVVNDMLLLENQLPFFVLQEIWNLLMDRRVNSGDRLENYYLYLLKDYSPTNSTEVGSDVPPRLRDPHHILHLFHRYILPGSNPEPGRWSPQDTIPCATELSAAGVTFRCKDAEVLEADFSAGVMTMAPLKVYDYTESYFQNLIAFEQCFPAAGNEASSYAVLLDFLIDTPADVAVLRHSRILISGVGSDTNLSLFFNKLSRDAYSYRTGKLYTDLRQYCKVGHRRHMAELKRNYFRSPWSSISLFAAVLLLLTTAANMIIAAINRAKPLSP